MNRRKAADYSAIYEILDTIMAQPLSETERSYEIGRAVCSRSEKGAAVMDSEYLRERYPEQRGFSPRSLRRMRDFYRAYENGQESKKLALQVGWTLNLIILEHCDTAEERRWYLQQVLRHGWKKATLLKQIQIQAWERTHLDG